MGGSLLWFRQWKRSSRNPNVQMKQSKRLRSRTERTTSLTRVYPRQNAFPVNKNNWSSLSGTDLTPPLISSHTALDLLRCLHGENHTAIPLLQETLGTSRHLSVLPMGGTNAAVADSNLHPSNRRRRSRPVSLCEDYIRSRVPHEQFCERAYMRAHHHEGAARNSPSSLPRTCA